MDIPNLYDSPLTVFTLWFISTYIIGYLIIFKNWDMKYKSEASSCLMSLAHGTPALVLSIFSICQSTPNISQLDYTSPNTPLQDTVLEYSIAYFMMDLLHYMIMVPSDALFIAHHLATLYVLTTCRYVVQHGAVAILGILVLAEATTTCQNTWSLARYRRSDSAKAKAVFELVSPLFYGYYSVVRGILGPLFVYKIVLVFGGGGVDGVGVIPKWAWVSWIIVIVVGIGLSMLWVIHLWIDLYKEWSNKEEVKKTI